MREGQDRVLITFANMVKACCCVTNAFVQDCALCENYNTSHNLQVSEGKFVYFQLVQLLIFEDTRAVLEYKEKKCHAKVDRWIPNQPQRSFASPSAKPNVLVYAVHVALKI